MVTLFGECVYSRIRDDIYNNNIDRERAILDNFCAWAEELNLPQNEYNILEL